MQRFGILPVVVVLAALPLGGCVVVVGNDLDDESRSWRDEEPRRMIGVTMGRVDGALASQLTDVDPERSTLILGVIGDMPADRAGVKEHDIVVQIDGSDDASPDDLARAIRRKDAGEELKLRVIRAGQPLELTVIMDSQKKASDIGS
jgi:S1-C subfamily serine protease